jgi:HD-GYP domain-containing protein (c-di-GMP phosphodiesterase class II)/signal transduction histidine kinase
MLYNDIMIDSPELFEKKFSILTEISNAIVVTDNISTITNLMLDLAINYTNAEKGSLMLVNEQGELYIHAARGIDINLVRTYKVKIGKGIAGTVAKSRLPVLVEDIGKDEHFRGKERDRYKTRSFISCPVVSRNKLLGVLNINDKKDNKPFTEDEFALLKIIANQAAIVLENAFLMNQIKAKAAELEEMNRKLIETDVVKTEFLTRVSHELRTPLNSIKGSIYYLQQNTNQSSDQQTEFYDIIAKETSNLTAIIERLLDFLRLEDETRLIKKSVLNLADVLREVVNQKYLGNTLERKHLLLTLDIQDSISDIVGDRIRIIELFINLIEGLNHYLEKNDTIKITVRENDSVNVNIAISRRLPQNVLPLLFDSRTVFLPGTSEEKLKLYLARKIAEGHQWNLQAENSDDSFLVSLTIPKSTRYKIDAFIGTTMEMFVDLLSELMDLDICSVMLADELVNELTIKSSRGLDDEVVKRTRIKIGDSISGWVALEGKPLLIENIESDARFKRNSISQYNTKSLISMPLIINDKVIGVLNLNNKKTGEPFTDRDLCIASMVSERFLSFVKNLHSGEYREDEYKQYIASLDSLLNAEKKYRKKDSFHATLMIKIMDRIGATEEDKRNAVYVSMLYDLGLALLDDAVFEKKKLQPSEINSIKVHPYTGVTLLDHFEFSEDIKNVILHHHERFDGKGYPGNLKGEEIPFLARVLSIVDAFCAMITKKNYRKALTKEDALQEINNGSGTVYDPKIVEALQEAVSGLPLPDL